MNKEKFIVSKAGFLLTFIMAIVVYALSLILDIVLFVVAAQHLYFSIFWYFYVNIVIEIFFALGMILSSSLILMFTKEKDKGSQTLMTFVSYYLLILGAVSFLSATFNSIAVPSIWEIIALIFSILQIAFGVCCVISAKKSPKIGRILLIVGCALISVSNLLNLISYGLAEDFIDMVISIFVLAFICSIIVTLAMMKIKNEGETESAPLAVTNTNASLTTTNAPLAEKKPSEEEKLTLLLKYKDLLDKGVITQEEFDAKKKELL